MGRKRRAAPPKSPAPAANSTSATKDSGIKSDANANTTSPEASLKLECVKALTTLRTGDYTGYLKLMKDLRSRLKESPHSALFHRVQATVCVEIVSMTKDAKGKRVHLKNAIENARNAVRLSPNSIEYAHFYSNLLYEAANSGNEYEEVMIECDRALAIENPVDPAYDSLQDENQQEISTLEARLANFQSKLRSLIHKSNMVCLSIWMKNLDYDKLVPTKRVHEDSDKRTEDRRKEPKVKRAQLPQQRPVSSNLRNDSDKGVESGLGSGQRAEGKRKNVSLRKPVPFYHKMVLVRSCWNSMSSDAKKDLLRIKISDLRAHSSSSKDRSYREVIDEALSFIVESKVLRFWTCFSCNEKFPDAGIFMKHIFEEHVGSLVSSEESIMPSYVEKDWEEMLLNFPAKPLDFDAAIRMLDKQPKFYKPDILDKSCSRPNADDSSPEENISVNICSSNVQDEIKFSDVEWMDFDGDQISKWTSFIENLPLCDDPERAQLLVTIQSIFEKLIKHKCLAASHLKHVSCFVMEELRGMARGSPLSSNMHRTPLCICFLDAPQLRVVLNFLQELSCSGGLIGAPDEFNVAKFNCSSNLVADIEKIVIGPDASFLVLDEKSLPYELHFSSCNDAANDIFSAPTSSPISYDSGVVLSSNALLSWIFIDPCSGELFTKWKSVCIDKAKQGLDLLPLLSHRFGILLKYLDEKREQLNYQKALKEVRNLCLVEKKRRERGTEFIHRGYDYVLKKRWEQIIGINSKRFEVNAIKNIWKDAESQHVKEFGDIRYVEDDDRTTMDYGHQVDYFIEAAIERERLKIDFEICKSDAKILRVIALTTRLEEMVNSASFNDFIVVLIPLIKSFLQERLEDLAGKDATEKSNAAAEALLAELDRDSKKTGPGLDSSKNKNEKPNDKKKKNKNKNKKNKDMEASTKLQDQTTKEILLPITQEAGGQGPEISVHVCDDALRLQEDEYKRRIELKNDERKLEKYLEYQRCIENKHKEEIPAEQHENIPETSVGKAETVANPDTNLSQNDGDKDAKQSTIMNDGTAEILENVQNDTADRDSLTTGFKSEGIQLDDSPTKLRDRNHLPLMFDMRDNDPGQPGFLQNAYFDENAQKAAEILRQLQAEVNMDEKKSNADLKKDIRQTLVATDGDNRMDTYGIGLKNETGEYNCFINVIIQSLWHVKRFRYECFWRTWIVHSHVGDPCVICALFDISVAMEEASMDNTREAVNPTSLRVALSNLWRDSNFFKEMNDASEVLGEIFSCLHKSLTPAFVASDTKSTEHICPCSCIAHSTFGMDILETMNCQKCGLESRCHRYSSFIHHINANSLRTAKAMHSEKPFDELLNLVALQHELACDPESGGCGKLNSMHQIMSTPPHVFTTVLGWQTAKESVEDIKATLKALSTEIDISVIYRGLSQQTMRRMVSMVCYVGLHYLCFIYNQDQHKWIMFDDENVEVIGEWNDVLIKCERGHLQPQILLFEAVTSTQFALLEIEKLLGLVELLC